jgi:hypothetical protein
VRWLGEGEWACITQLVEVKSVSYVLMSKDNGTFTSSTTTQPLPIVLPILAHSVYPT